MGGYERGRGYEVKKSLWLMRVIVEQLKNTGLFNRWQTRIVQACVENASLFDCQSRVWWKMDVRRLQKWMDKC